MNKPWYKVTFCTLIIGVVFGIGFNVSCSKDKDDKIQKIRNEFKLNNQCVPWDAIIKKSEYQKLSEDDKQKLRKNYFDDCSGKKENDKDYGREWNNFFIAILETEKKAGLGDYFNCLSGNCQNGKGTFEYYKGSTYEGSFKDAKKHGLGTITLIDGSKYEGQWEDNKAHGRGTYIWPNGAKYIGQFKDDEMHGHGTYTWPDGNKYVGQFKDDKMHGHGTYTWLVGNKYVGQWENGKMHGQGTYTWSDGRKDVGQWEDNKMHGQGILYDSKGKILKKGTFQNGKFTGK